MMKQGNAARAGGLHERAVVAEPTHPNPGAGRKPRPRIHDQRELYLIDLAGSSVAKTDATEAARNSEHQQVPVNAGKRDASPRQALSESRGGGGRDDERMAQFRS